MIFHRSSSISAFVVLISSIIMINSNNNNNNNAVVGLATAYNYDFDWEQAVKQIRRQRKRWQNVGVINYVFESQTSCFCSECYQTSKYLMVETKINNATTKDGELYERRRTHIIDAFFVPEKNTFGCDDTMDHAPYTSYQTIDGMFNEALEHAKEGRAANCNNQPPQPVGPDEDITIPPPICGGSIDIIFDPILKYPLFMSLSYGPFLADAGMMYTVGCMDVLLFADSDTDNNSNGTSVDLSKYTNACNL